MSSQLGSGVSRWLVVLAGAGLLLGGPGSAPAARAADLDRLESAIKEVPADAAFFSSMLRNREQIDLIAASKAWAKLTSMPSVQLAWTLLEGQLDDGGSLAPLRQWYKEPQNRELVELLGDMGSHEVFVYAGANSTDLAELLDRVLNVARLQGFQESFTGENKPLSDDATVRLILNALAKNPKQVHVPDLVLGFRLTDTKRATTQLQRLEKLLEEAAPLLPQIQGKIKRAKLAGGDFLVATLDSKTLGWDEQLVRKYEEKPGQYDGLVDRLNNLKLTISLGIRGKYLLLAFGETTAPLTQLGQGKRLTDRPELQPLARFAEQRLISVSYTSKAFHRHTRSSWTNIETWVSILNDALAQSKLKPNQQARLKKDLAELEQDLKKYLPEPGALLDFSFLTAGGWESYRYDHGLNPQADPSRPLDILNHAGGTPLLLAAGRGKVSLEGWNVLTKWQGVILAYFEEFVAPQMNPKNRKQFAQAVKVLKPLWERFDQTTRKELIPALADGQWALLVDAKQTGKQWFKGMPPARKPVPLLEPALVVGLSDAAAARRAFAEYRVILNDLRKELPKIDPEKTGFAIPAPQLRNVKAGELYFYPLPADLELDPRILPNVGVSDKVAVLALTQEHSERLFAPAPLQTEGFLMKHRQRPLSGVTYIHWAGLVDVTASWIDNVVEDAAKKADAGQVEDIFKQVRAAFDLLRVFRCSSSISYVENGVEVTHSETRVRDLP